jgi:hypothetical protein
MIDPAVSLSFAGRKYRRQRLSCLSCLSRWTRLYPYGSPCSQHRGRANQGFCCRLRLCISGLALPVPCLFLVEMPTGLLCTSWNRIVALAKRFVNVPRRTPHLFGDLIVLVELKAILSGRLLFVALVLLLADPTVLIVVVALTCFDRPGSGSIPPPFCIRLVSAEIYGGADGVADTCESVVLCATQTGQSFAISARANGNSGHTRYTAVVFELFDKRMTGSG